MPQKTVKTNLFKRCKQWVKLRKQLYCKVQTLVVIKYVVSSVFCIAIKESLQKNGTLGRFKGEIRAAVMNVLNKNASGDCGDAPKIPDETKLINELIREYLVWNGYLYSEQVLAAGKTVF